MRERIRRAIWPIEKEKECTTPKLVETWLLTLSLAFVGAAAFNPEIEVVNKAVLVLGALFTFLGSDFFKNLDNDESGELTGAIMNRDPQRALRAWWEEAHLSNKFWMNFLMIASLGAKVLTEKTMPGTPVSEVTQTLSLAVVASRLSWNAVTGIVLAGMRDRAKRLVDTRKEIGV